MEESAKQLPGTTAYIPHVGWLRHEPGEEVISLLRQGYFEASEQAFYWLYLRPGDTFIDCGAHIGFYSIIADRVTRGATRIVAVEPSCSTSEYLELNLKQSDVRDALIIRSAVWMDAGQIQFIDEAEGKAAYAHVAFDEDGVVGASVSTITLNQIVDGLGAKDIALVKIDVEGAETEALMGARRAIDSGALPVLMVEFTEHNLRRRGLTSDDLVRQLRGLNYTLCEFSPESLELTPFLPVGPIWYKNLFACKDLDKVNARLRTASDENRIIAQDILDRAAACSRFKELEEMEYFQSKAAEVDGFQHWAEEAEARAIQAQQVAESNRAWAERTEQNLVVEKGVSAQWRTRAESSEARAIQAQQVAESNRAWAERTEQNLTSEKEASAQLRTLVESTELRVTRAQQAADSYLARAEHAEQKLSAEMEVSNQLRGRAEGAEARDSQTQRELKQLRAFAKKFSWLHMLYEKSRGHSD